MLKPKVITIFGSKEVGKTTLYRLLVKNYFVLEKKKHIKSSPLINHAEDLINLKNNIYKLIDTPEFKLRPATLIDEKVQKKTQELLSIKSDLIL
jgi:GTPase SAR1 family protein